jgi:hypothetical protein
MYGFTENYVKVEAIYDPSLVNQLVNVHLEQLTLDETVKVTIEKTLVNE